MAKKLNSKTCNESSKNSTGASSGCPRSLIVYLPQWMEKDERTNNLGQLFRNDCRLYGVSNNHIWSSGNPFIGDCSNASPGCYNWNLIAASAYNQIDSLGILKALSWHDLLIRLIISAPSWNS